MFAFLDKLGLAFLHLLKKCFLLPHLPFDFRNWAGYVGVIKTLVSKLIRPGHGRLEGCCKLLQFFFKVASLIFRDRLTLNMREFH